MAKRSADLGPLMRALGHTFNDEALLLAALTHSSYAHENGLSTDVSSERLEFLGDAMLNFITGEFLYHAYPGRSEGELTVARAALVQTRTLAMFARRLNLGDYLRLTKGEERAGARQRENLLADTFEAVLAALALDASWQVARDFVVPLLEAEMAAIEAGTAVSTDYKSLLQHRIQGLIGITPVYVQVEMAGPDHERSWTMQVWVDTLLLGTGSAASKQAASQQAARKALETLDGPNPPRLPDPQGGGR